MTATSGFVPRWCDGETAAIIRHSPEEIVFAVDSVAPAVKPLPTEEAAAQVARRLGGDLLASSVEPGETVIKLSETRHPLVAAVHQAFAEHRPLCLSPDAIWLTIAQGFSHHVALYPEELRDRLVLYEGKEEISVKVEELSEPEHWAAVVAKWAAKIDAKSLMDTRRLACDFSTTTPTIRTASQIVVMETFRHYFDYMVLCVCGIPELALRGTPEDWHSLRERVEWLSGFGLEWWTERLLPICDAFVQTSEGYPPLDFWQEIYKPESVYGGDVITGWIADLFPYVIDYVTKAPTHRNPILKIPRDQIAVRDGLTEDRLPLGLSKAPFKLRMSDGTGRNLELVGGFLGVVERRSGEGIGILEPTIGWGVRPCDTFSALLDALLEHAEYPLPAPAPTADMSKLVYQYGAFPAELIELLERSEGPMFRFSSGGVLRIRLPLRQEKERRIGTRLVRFAEMEDGRVLCCRAVLRSRDPRYPLSNDRVIEWPVLVCRDQEPWNDSRELEKAILAEKETIFVASNLPTFFECLLASPERPFFDAPDFVPEEQPEEGRGRF